MKMTFLEWCKSDKLKFSDDPYGIKCILKKYNLLFLDMVMND